MMIDSTSGRRHVVVLFNDSERRILGHARDMLAEEGVVACAHDIAAALRSSGHQVDLLPLHGDVELALSAHSPSKWTIFNLAEGLDGRMFEEARIAWALEAMGYSITGARGQAIALTTHKARCKAVLAGHGVPTPAWRSLSPGQTVSDDIREAVSFPAIVKPVAEDASIGLDESAVVHSIEQLGRRAASIWQHYRQSALVEAFVDGREFNIAIWGSPAEVLPLAEIDFTAFDSPAERIVSYAAKWEVDAFAYSHTPAICPAVVEATLAERIRHAAREAWNAVGGAGYGRVDLRVAQDGTPYVIEVNCNPDISADAGFYRAAQAAGYSYAGMAEHILEEAL